MQISVYSYDEKSAQFVAEGLTFTYSIRPSDQKFNENWPNNRIVITHNQIGNDSNVQQFMSKDNDISIINKADAIRAHESINSCINDANQNYSETEAHQLASSKPLDSVNEV